MVSIWPLIQVIVFHASVAAATSQSHSTVVLLTADKPSYRTAAQAFQEQLSEARISCVAITIPAQLNPQTAEALKEQILDAKPGLIASTGSAATRLALDNSTDMAVVFFMEANPLDSELASNGELRTSRLTGVAAVPSPEQQVQWIRKTMPTARQVAVLHSPRTSHTVQLLQSAAEAQQLTVKAVPSTKEQFPLTIDKLNASDCDGVLMVLDAGVFNSATIKRLLLWGIRQKKPVWTFSPKIVKSGAFASISSSAQAVGQRAATLTTEILQGADVATMGVYYPDAMTTSVNVRTADLIDLSVPKVVLKNVSQIHGER